MLFEKVCMFTPLYYKFMDMVSCILLRTYPCKQCGVREVLVYGADLPSQWGGAAARPQVAQRRDSLKDNY